MVLESHISKSYFWVIFPRDEPSFWWNEDDPIDRKYWRCALIDRIFENTQGLLQVYTVSFSDQCVATFGSRGQSGRYGRERRPDLIKISKSDWLINTRKIPLRDPFAAFYLKYLMLFSLFGWELVWIRKFERISIRNPDQTLSVTSHPRRAAISTLPRWFDRYFLPTQSFPNPEPEQCPKWWWLFIAEQKCSKKDVPCEQSLQIFLDLQKRAVMYRG